MTNTKKKRKRLILLDAHAIIHRAYHALPDFTGPTGEPTGALYGIISMLIHIIQELDPDYIAACYDLPGPTIRHQADAQYKANRQKSDDALIAQIIRSRDIFKAFSIPIYDRAGFEADDVIGTIVHKLFNNSTDIIIASGDMDTMQLVSGNHVQVYTLKKGLNDTILYDEGAVEKRFGFSPKYIPDWKGLRGDPSDNIIGIPGIGEKTATILIQLFGNMEQIYKSLKKDEAIFISKGIKPRIVSLLKEHEDDAIFSKALAVIRTDAPIVFSLPKTPWNASVHLNVIINLLQKLGFQSLINRIYTVFGNNNVSITQDDKPVEKFSEVHFTQAQIMLWLLSSEITSPTLEDILAYTKQQTFAKAYENLIKNIERNGRLADVYKKIEKPLILIIKNMEQRGILIDTTSCTTLSKKYHKELTVLEKQIYKVAGHTFNINSPQQLSVVLFDELHLSAKRQKRTSAGHRSTRQSELQKIRGQHAVIDTILEYREIQKLLSTYIDNLPVMLDANNRLHTSFLQAGTSTGRMASHNPNLQNIPNHGKRAASIRNMFIASQSYTFVGLDYSQIELRIAAILSGDEKMLSIFHTNRDVHKEIAARVFHVPIDEVDDDMRRKAKVINFGILYGMGVQALRQQIGTSLDEARDFYQRYFKEFNQLAQYLENTKETARKDGYTETLFGRRRYFPEIRSSLPYVRAQAERMAINAPIQGTQADIIKIAMVRVQNALSKKNLEIDTHLLLQVHDELIYEVSTTKVEEVITIIAHTMETVLTKEQSKGIELRTEIKTGDTWGTLQPYHRKI